MTAHQSIVLFVSIILLSSCSSGRYAKSDAKSFDYNERTQVQKSEGDASALHQIPDDDQQPSEPDGEQEFERKLIYTASMSMEVDSVEPAKKEAMKITKSFKGYMLNSSNTSLTVRIPAEDLTLALTAFKKLGKVTYENLYGNDVTDSYFDTKIRLENAEKARDRYLELLKEAKNVSEIIRVEKELERINEKVERLKARMKSYDQNINYSRVTLGFQAKKDKVRPGPLGYIFVGLYKGIKWLFVWD
jgi:hypothetical protein